MDNDSNIGIMDIIDRVADTIALYKHMENDVLRKTLKDVNLVQFFSSKNIIAINKAMADAGNGLYKNLLYANSMTAAFEITYIDGKTLHERSIDYIIKFLSSIQDTPEVEDKLFIGNGIMTSNGVNGNLVTLFMIALVYKIKK